jgi:hypothetical protein
MTRRDDDKFKALFKIKGFFDAIPKAWERACTEGGSEDAAVRILLGALNAHARRPSLQEVARFTTEVVPAHGLLASLTVVFAAWKWYRDHPEGMVLATLAAMPVAAGADLDPKKGRALRTEVFRMAYALHVRGPRSEGGEPTKRNFRSLLATSLAPSDDPVVAAEGRALLREHLADLREAVVAASTAGVATDGLRDLRAELAKALANLGQSLQDWTKRHDCDDKVARLEEALVLHNEAMTFPERVADADNPLGLYHSLRMRGTCQRILAARLTDDDRRLRLLDGAVADARAARDLYRRRPDVFPDGALIVVNLVNALKDRLDLLLELGLVDHDEARRGLDELRLLAREARSDRGYAIGPSLLEQMHGGLDRLSARLEGQEHTSDHVTLARHLVAAISTMEDREADPIDPSAARAVVQELEQLPEHERLPAWVMNLLGGFFAGLHVDVLGPSLCARAMRQEARLLAVDTGEARPIVPGRPDVWDPVQYVEQGIIGFRARMANPTWAHPEKRISAGWMGLLVSALLTWAARGVRPIDILADLRLADLRGSTAWRSDLSFYGAGPTHYSPRQRMETAEEWRLHVYRTRFERDMAAEYLHAIDMQRLMSQLTGAEIPSYPGEEYHRGAQIFPKGTPREVIRAATPIPEHLWQETPDGTVVPNVVDEGSARVESTKLLAELEDGVGKMVHEGWMPRGHPDVPEATADHLREWLAAHPDTAILNVGAGLSPSLVGHDGSTVWFERIEDPDEVGALIQAYEFARDEHSFGRLNPSSGVLAPGLSDAEREARYRRSIATPETTETLDQATREMLAALGAVFGPPLARARERGVCRLLLLLRGWARHVPWFAVPVNEGMLGDTFAAAVVETLAPVERVVPRRGPSGLYIGGRAGRGSSLALGKAVLTPLSDRSIGPSDRDTFEELTASCRVLRVFAHGTAMVLHTEAGGIELDEDDLRSVNRYSVSEARMLDLRGARRVELWACESGRSDALYSRFVPHDEPAGMDAAVLLAGAECAIGSLWTQYVLSSAMIAEAFTLELAARPQLEVEALAAAVRRYREGMVDGGVFAAGVARHAAAAPRPVRIEGALRAGLDAWRTRAWSDLLGRDAPALPDDLAIEGLRLGPSRADQRMGAGQGPELVEQILAPYRSPLAWAGWRVTLRSKEVFDPLPTPES